MKPNVQLGLILLVFACAPEAQRVRSEPTELLSRDRPRAVLDLPEVRSRETIGVVIERIINPDGNAFTLAVYALDGEAFESEQSVLANLTPFPPENPGCFAVRLDPDIMRVMVELAPIGDGELPEEVRVSIMELEECSPNNNSQGL